MSENADILTSLREISKEYTERGLNEADTRHKIIDFILHELFAWPRRRCLRKYHLHLNFYQ